ncbi:MAG: hypothetical protein QOH29_2183 [Actinomycetota bacterium]|nr:hypothetical protein [Actinomycetota bacterium]
MLAIMSKAAAFVGAGALALSVPALAGAAVGFPGLGVNAGAGVNTGTTVGAPGLGINTGVGANAGVGVNAHGGVPGMGRGYGSNPYNPYYPSGQQGWTGNSSYGQGWNGNSSYGHGQHGYGQHGYGSHGYGGHGYRG